MNRLQQFRFIALAALCLACPVASRAQITDLANFNGTNGANSYGSLILIGSTLYGTTSTGGANGDGAVFSVPVGGGTPTVLASFNNTNGENPYGGLTLIGNTFYGTTYYGGANGDGTVFSVPMGGGTPTVLASFNGTNGLGPGGSLTLSADGNTFYGTTGGGGANGHGTAFSVPVSGGTPTVLTSFNGTTNGNGPGGGLTLIGSTLYGTTEGGGDIGYGEVFSVPVGGGTPTLLASFNNTNGSFATGNLTLIGSTLYGTTESGGAHDSGEVFSVPVGGGTPTVLGSFSSTTNGASPAAGLTLSADGSTFYGTTLGGGANDDGAIFSVPVSGGTPTLVASFSGTANGADPGGGLTLIGNTLYGTTSSGGTSNAGTVFSLAVPAPEPGSPALQLAGLFAVSLRRRRAAIVERRGVCCRPCPVCG